MPYIKQEERKKFTSTLRYFENAIESKGISPGDLNYVISMMINLYVDRKGLSYTHLNDVVGVLDSAKAEFQRTVVASYEERKIKENGGIK